MEKQCFCCGQTKPLADFYRHPKMADGHLGKCKECTKAYVKARRFSPDTREAVLAYDRARGSRQTKQYRLEYKEKYPIKYKAHSIVSNAIRDGKLFPQPCCVCGRVDTIHAHHDDYARPLNVRWLCAAHHHQWHAANGEGKNAS